MIMLCEPNIFVFVGYLSMILWSNQANAEFQKLKKDGYEVRIVSQNATLIKAVKFLKFTDFKKLNLREWFSEANLKSFPKQLSFGFQSDGKLTLDRKFEADDFKQVVVEQLIVLRFSFVDGFDLERFAFKITKNFGVTFYVSNFYLVKNGQAWSSCEANDFAAQVSYFNPISYLIFDYGTKYTTKMCPFVFKNSEIDAVSFNSLSDCFLKRNLISFQTRPSTLLNSSIDQLWLGLYEVDVTSSLFDSQVFEKTTNLIINGYLHSVESDAFAKLRQLVYVRLNLPNVRSFFARGIDWIRKWWVPRTVNMSDEKQLIENLGSIRLIQTYSSLSEISDDQVQKDYAYPDEDFCMFAQFPFNRILFIDPQFDCSSRTCSCTLLWLRRYMPYLKWSKKARRLINLYVYDLFTIDLDRYNHSFLLVNIFTL